MSLTVKRVVLRDFRGYESVELSPDPELTILVGPNAAGKTNLVEAIQLITAGTSFRRPQLGEVVRWGSPEAEVLLEAEGEGRRFETSLVITESGRRTYRVNGKIRRRITEVTGIIPCVVFTPDDLRMVKDSADRRRAAIDGVGDQLSPAFFTARMEYERVVRQRNALLKTEALNTDVFDALTERLVAQGAQFMGHRRRLFDRVSRKMSEVYGELTQGEQLLAEYRPSWTRLGLDGFSGRDEAQIMAEALGRVSREERARGVSLVGPHRDEIVFSVNGREARAFASQGQTRTIALSWKLAEVKVVAEIAEQTPLLLLDDVMSELDEGRRHALAAFCGKVAQTFITTTTLGYFEDELVSRARVVQVS